jgi:chromosome segregation ATPase
MQDQTEAQTRKDLNAEIKALDKRYHTIEDYLAGTETEDHEITAALQAFKNDLSTISAHILTLYQLKGQRTKITWNSLFENIDTALETIRSSAHAKLRAAIETALNMSEPKIEEVMAYLATLKKSL